jgi:hypothetical protein
MREACARPIGLYPRGQFLRRLGRLFAARTLLPRWRWISHTSSPPPVVSSCARCRPRERACDRRWSSARAHLDGRDDAPVRVAPQLAPPTGRCVGAVSLDEFDGVRLGPGLRAPPPNDQPNTGFRRIPSVIGRPHSDFLAPQMEPMRASRTEKRDILSGEAADVFYR